MSDACMMYFAACQSLLSTTAAALQISKRLNVSCMSQSTKLVISWLSCTFVSFGFAAGSAGQYDGSWTGRQHSNRSHTVSQPASQAVQSSKCWWPPLVNYNWLRCDLCWLSVPENIRLTISFHPYCSVCSMINTWEQLVLHVALHVAHRILSSALKRLMYRGWVQVSQNNNSPTHLSSDSLWLPRGSQQSFFSVLRTYLSAVHEMTSQVRKGQWT